MATQYVTCPRCSAQNTSLNSHCLQCGTMLPPSPPPMQHVGQPLPGQIPGADKKLAAGLCGILLGSFGIHKFILGYQNEGIIYLVAFAAIFILSMVTCGLGSILFIVPAVIGIIEGITYLTKSDEEFVQTYIINKKPWF